MAKRTVAITERGVARVEDWLGIDNLYESLNTPLVGYLNNALKAKELYKRDKDYIVNDGEVLIVDEFTGRILYGRRYNEGMHQAIEAKEGVEIKQENQTLATITLQNYFRLYEKLSGMTGTAHDRGGRVQQGLQGRRGADPDAPADDPRATSRTSSTRARRRSSTRSSRTSSSGTSAASRCWSARSAWRTPRSCRRCCAAGASRTRCSTRSTTPRKPRSSPRPAGAAGSPSPPTWPAVVPTSCSAATPSSWPRRSCATAGSTRTRRRRSTRPRWRTRSRAGRSSATRRPTRSSRPAVSTCSAPSGTTRAASTTSCAVGRAGRATRASRGSTCPCRTI